jgi:hypothetical protein
MIACCPSPIYALTTVSTTGGDETCDYILCNITGFASFKETAECVENSVIIENSAGDENVGGDAVRGCAFNSSGNMREVLNSASRIASPPGQALQALVLVLLGLAVFG